MTGSAYTVALAMIARDEAPRIGRLLASVAPWVDHMLVLDTGSSDGTAAVAAAHGARVEHFAWCEDFAAARNVALDKAGADWHLVLDADDVLHDGGAALAALRHTAPDFVGAVQIQELGGAAGLAQAWTSRVLPGAVRYAGRVHEQPQHTLPVRRLPVLVRHDGYTPERLAAKQGRNRQLLLAMLADAPDDAYLWFQLGKDHAAYDEHAAAAAAFERADALRRPEHGWHRDMSARLLYALKHCGQHARAMRFAEQHMDACNDSPDFFFALGDLLLDWTAERPADATQLLPLAEAAWLRCLELGERPDHPGSVQGRGSWLAAHNLAVLHDGLGQPAEAAALRARHPWPDDPAACRAAVASGQQ